MPASVDADWTYRVNDHRQQGAPLVAVPVPAPVPIAPDSSAGVASASASPSASAAQQLVHPFSVAESDGGDGGGDIGDDGGGGGDAANTAKATAVTTSDGGGCGGRGPIAIAAGWRHSVAVTAEGAVFVWGCGAGGRLGLGSHADVDTPRQVSHVGDGCNVDVD